MAGKKDGPSQEFMQKLHAYARLGMEGYPHELQARLRELEVQIEEGREVQAAKKDIREIRSAFSKMKKDYLGLGKSIIPGRLLYDREGVPPMPGPFFGGPTSADRTLLTAERMSSFGGYTPRARNFDLQLRCFSDQTWGVADANDTYEGVAGWAEGSTGIARISNLNGKGTLQGKLNLRWTGTVPADGRYFIAPSLALLHSGICSTQGDYGKDVNAVASATIYSFLTLGTTTLSESSVSLSYAESRRQYDDDVDGMAPSTIMASDWLAFDARLGQDVQLLVYLDGYTWTRGKGDAEVEITKFGLVSNVWDDTKITVYEGLTVG
jgi:hypothetical protein